MLNKISYKSNTLSHRSDRADIAEAQIYVKNGSCFTSYPFHSIGKDTYQPYVIKKGECKKEDII